MISAELHEFLSQFGSEETVKPMTRSSYQPAVWPEVTCPLNAGCKRVNTPQCDATKCRAGKNIIHMSQIKD